MSWQPVATDEQELIHAQAIHPIQLSQQVGTLTVFTRKVDECWSWPLEGSACIYGSNIEFATDAICHSRNERPFVKARLPQ